MTNPRFYDDIVGNIGQVTLTFSQNADVATRLEGRARSVLGSSATLPVVNTDPSPKICTKLANEIRNGKMTRLWRFCADLLLRLRRVAAHRQ